MNTKQFSTFLRRHAAFWPILLMSVLLGIGFYFVPWVCDDLNYREPFRDYFLNGASFTYGDIFTAFQENEYIQNSRLASLAMCHLMFLPQWLTAILSTIVVGSTMWVGLRLINRQNNVMSALLLCSGYAFLMPWGDQMYVFDFQVNYIWGTLLSLILCYLLMYTRCCSPIMFVFALITGAWHECSGFPTLVGLITLSVYSKDYRNRRLIATVAGLFCGLLWLWLAPAGQNYRAGFMSNYSMISTSTLIFVVPIIAYLIVCAVRFRRHTIRNFDILLLAMCLTSVGVEIIYPMGPRILWQGDMAAIIGLCACVNTKQFISKGIAVVIYVLMCVHLIAVDMHCYHQRAQYNDIVAKIKTYNPESTIFADVETPDWLLLASLQKPLPNNFTNYTNVNCIDRFYTGNTDPKKLHCIVPAKLEGIKSNDGEEICGSDGFRMINGYIVGPLIDEQPCELPLTITKGNKAFSANFYHVPFTTDDGKRMAWYHLCRSSLFKYIQPDIQSINLQ